MIKNKSTILNDLMDSEAFDKVELTDYVCSHGFGDPTQEGVELGKQLIADGEDYATAGHEIVARGLTTESE